MSVDLTTRYMGLALKNPLVASAGPLTGDLDSLRRLQDAGIAAAVMPSLFEEQIEHDELELNRLAESHTESFAESLTYFPSVEDYNVGPRDYLQQLEEAKRQLAIPVLASLNGSSEGGWTRYARSMQEAGADALELNIHFVPTAARTAATDVEQRYVDLVASIRSSVKIPLAVKLGPYFTSIPNIAQRIVEAGADGLVLFNRFLEPDIDLESLQFTPNLVLSSRHELRLPLRWIAILRDQVPAALAATSGVHAAEDVIKVLLAGADVAMMTTVLLRQGVGQVGQILGQLVEWLEANEYTSVDQLQGSMSYGNCPDPSALQRANYMKALTSFTWDDPVPREEN